MIIALFIIQAYYYKVHSRHIEVCAIWMLWSECFDRKAIDCNFIVLFSYLSIGWEAIETKMATKYFCEFIRFYVTVYHYFKQSSTFDSFTEYCRPIFFGKEHRQFVVIIDPEMFNIVPYLQFHNTIQGVYSVPVFSTIKSYISVPIIRMSTIY